MLHKERVSVIEKEIKDLRMYYRSRWNLRGYRNINHGFCESFAEDLKERLSSYNIDVKLVNSDSMKFNPDDGDNSDWNPDEVLKINLQHPKNIDYKDINKLKLGYHVWIYDDVTKKHYDSESPRGVKCLFKLPIYNRAIKRFLEFNSLFEELFVG